jgi:ribosomal-protein-alanine N-acetyltransferase
MRLMHTEDINQVTEIDHEAFPTMWPPVNYRHELQNPLAHYIVACDEEKTVEEPEVEVALQKGFSRLKSRVRQWFSYDRFSGKEMPSSVRQYISGFAGFWVMADEAHIISLAVRETYRHRGIGELLLIATIDLAAQLKARIITLEVRASNTAALSLYDKYGFTQVGLRRAYYIDNKEDAILMSTENITSALFQARLQQLKCSHSRKWGIPLYQVAR